MLKLPTFITKPARFFYGAGKKVVSLGKSKAAAKQANKAGAGLAITPAMQKNLRISVKVDLLKDMVLDGDYHSVASIRNNLQSAIGPQDNAQLAQFMAVIAQAELAQAHHDEVMSIGREMVDKFNDPVGYYYRAQSLFVRGQYEPAMLELQNLLRVRPRHADGVYLLCEICEQLDNYELAWQSLETLALTSKRNKTWHVMANFVQQSSDVFRLLKNWSKWKEDKVGPAFHHDVSEFIALGALRAGNYEMARSIWRETIFSASKKKGSFTSLKARQPSYSSKRAEAALSDLNAMFNDANIEMFLVSGTLLGCVREGRLLGHDKDIDIGIWSTVSESEVLELATTTGKFFVLKSRSPEILRLKHVNGIAIDVFYHFKKRSDYWHGGVKMVWHNSPFKLVKREFLEEEYLIPEDYDLYLTENYGDWKTPMIKFDSAFDTPNGEVLSEEEMAIHSFKGLLASAIDDNWERIIFYLNKLREFGENDFAEEFELKCVKSEAAKEAFANLQDEDEDNGENDESDDNDVLATPSAEVQN